MSPKTTTPTYASAAGARGRAIPAWATMPFFAVDCRRRRPPPDRGRFAAAWHSTTIPRFTASGSLSNRPALQSAQKFQNAKTIRHNVTANDARPTGAGWTFVVITEANHLVVQT